MSTAKELSKQEWTGNSTIESINSGSLQRIADAAEKMAQNYSVLIRQRDEFQRWYHDEQRTSARLNVQLSSAKGQITKLKNAAKAASSTSEAA